MASRAPNSVFISYRRADSAAWAAKLAEHIGFRFGHDLVFRDIDDIAFGADFRHVIARELARCRVFLVVIGPLWVVNAQGVRRLDNPKDILRNEVLQSLQSARAGGTVIPVLVGGAPMPRAADIPRALRPLLRLNAVTLRASAGTGWARDIKALLDQLQALVLPTAARLPLPRAQGQMQARQEDFFALLRHDPARALELARKAQGELDRALPLYPHDPVLKVTRGYLCKDEALALIALGRDAEARERLARADTSFNVMLRENRRDASAWNGLGSVALVRADLARRAGRRAPARELAQAGLRFIDKALAIEPRYDFALHDRRLAQQLLAELA
jgi:hypothetical protein